MTTPSLTEEQSALLETVRSLFDKRADSAAVRRADGFDADLWRTLVEQIGVPTYELPQLPGGVDLAGLYELAAALCEQGLA